MKTYDTTLARIAGNIAAGLVNHPAYNNTVPGEDPKVRTKRVVNDAMEMAQLIVAAAPMITK